MPGRFCRRRLLACLIALAAAAPRAAAAETAAESSEPITLAGEVIRGASYAVKLIKGLEFRLKPIEFGWLIWVGDPARPDDNYAAIVTPPFHGPNDTVIEGWHFRNSDNTGPNEPGSKNLNVPQERRSFRFVITRAAYESARAALDIMLWPSGRTAAEIEAAGERWDSVATASGELMITELELGNLVPGKQAWIEGMAFTLVLRYPP